MPTDADSHQSRVISLRDIGLVVYFGVLLVPAWLAPEKWLAAIGRAIAWSTERLHPRRTRRDTAALQSLFGERLPSPPSRVHAEVVAGTHVHNMLYLRALRPYRWSPSIRVDGMEHVLRALQEQRGVVLWTAPTVYDGLMTKVVLAESGLQLGHLSHLHHGLSVTKFGIRVLNRLVRAAEGRYIGARFVMQPGTNVQALRELRRWIEANKVVTITALGGSGARTSSVRFLDRTFEVPTGAPELARRTGSELAAASTIRERDGSFVTRIEPLDWAAGDNRRQTLASAAGAFAEVTSAHVAACPGQCAAFLYHVV